MQPLIDVAFFGALFFIGFLIRKKRRESQPLRDQKVMAAAEAQDAVGLGTQPLWVILLMALALPVIILVSMILNPSLQIVGTSVWLNFTITLAIGILFTHFAQKRQGWKVPDMLMIALYVSPLLYVVVPWFLVNVVLGNPQNTGGDLWLQEYAVAMGAFALIPGTLVVATLTNRRYRRVKYMLAQVAKAKEEGKPMPTPEEFQTEVRARVPRKPGATMISWGGVLVFLGLQSLVGAGALVMGVTGVQAILLNLLWPLVELAAGIWLIVTGFRKNKADNSKFD